MKYKLAVSLIAVAVLAGCSTQKVMINKPNSDKPIQTRMDESQAFFIGGIGQEKEVDAAQVCGGAEKVIEVTTQQNALDVILSFISGIYTPRHIKVVCSVDK